MKVELILKWLSVRKKIHFCSNVMSCIILIILVLITGCDQSFDNKVVLNDLNNCFLNNKAVFDSLRDKFQEVGHDKNDWKLQRRIKLKSNKGYNMLYNTQYVTYEEDITFGVRELDYGIRCGFFYLPNEKEDYFENPRVIRKRAEGAWYSYIYFN